MRKNIKTIIFCAAAVGVMIAIFMFSSQNSDDSSDLSRGFIRDIINMLPFFSNTDEAMKTKIISSVHNFVRKMAHFSIYAALGFCCAGAFMQKMSRWKKIIIGISAVTVCCLYAASDELHQLFIPGRSGEVRDVLIDTSGGAVGAMIYIGIYMLAQKVKNRRIKAAAGRDDTDG